MRNAILRLLPATALLVTLTGCTPVTSTTAFGMQNFTGNWYFHIQDPPGGVIVTIGSLSGALSGQGANITGIFRATGNGCVSPTQDIAFSGQQASDGTLQLSSTNVASNVITISTTPVASTLYGSPSVAGSLVVTGTGACAFTGSVLLGTELPLLTGNYAGPLTSAAGTTSSFSATFSQSSSANGDGQFPETGTITVTGPTCTNVFSLSGIVSGPTLASTLTETSGPAATATLTAGPVGFTTLNSLPFSITITGAGCNAGTFTGNLMSSN